MPSRLDPPNPAPRSDYCYQDIAPLTCPITAFAAAKDDVVHRSELAEWSPHIDGGFELIVVDGDHWFLDRNRELITATLEEIGAMLPANQPDEVVPSPTTQPGIAWPKVLGTC